MAILNAVLSALGRPLEWSVWQDVAIPNPATVNVIALQVLDNHGLVQVGLGVVGNESIWATFDDVTGGRVIPTFNGRVALRMIGQQDVHYRGAILA